MPKGSKGGHGPSGSTKGGTYKGGTPINAGKGGKYHKDLQIRMNLWVLSHFIKVCI